MSREAESSADDFDPDAVPATGGDSLGADVGERVLRDFVVPEQCDGERIDQFLTQTCDGHSRMRIRQSVQQDGATVDGRVVRPSFKVRTGQQIRFLVPALVNDDCVPENIPLDVLFEDDGLVVVNKPPGMVVHPARGNWTGTLTSALAFRFKSLSDVGGPTRPGIVHRLDRDTSGVIVVAKTNAIHIHLSEQFHDRDVAKEYIAIANGPLDRDRDVIDLPIGRHPYQRDKMAIRKGHITSKPASTFYEVMSRHGKYTIVKVMPKTGRTHQIRVHLSHIGTPVLCDRLYGGHAEVTRGMLLANARPHERSGLADAERDEVILNRQALHAHRLAFEHPHTGKTMSFEAPLPADMQRVMDTIS